MEDYLCTYGYDHFHIFVFIAPATVELPTRLTLYGYIDSSDNTYVMWSLSGDRNINIKDKIGVDAELVCKLNLVGLELKYDCLEGYDWLGQQIVLYTDPNVSYGGKLVGGIRIRAKRKAAAPAPKADDFDDPVPF